MQAAAQALGMMQSDRHHSEIQDYTLALHKQALDQTKGHHEDSLKRSALHHKHEQTIRWQLYATQREFAVDMARREALRDVWQQRNELTQTMLIVSTLLFGCTYTTLVDGVPTLPPKTDSATLIAFSTFVSSSLFILLLCIVMLVTLYRRITQYHIHRPLHRYPGCNLIHKDFNSYYSCHCQGLNDKALVCFYVGSATSYVGCALVFLTKIKLWYHDSVASTLLFIAPAVLVLVGLLVSMWMFPDKTHNEVVDYGGLSAETQSAYEHSTHRGLSRGGTGGGGGAPSVGGSTTIRGEELDEVSEEEGEDSPLSGLKTGSLKYPAGRGNDDPDGDDDADGMGGEGPLPKLNSPSSSSGFESVESPLRSRGHSLTPRGPLSPRSPLIGFSERLKSPFASSLSPFASSLMVRSPRHGGNPTKPEPLTAGGSHTAFVNVPQEKQQPSHDPFLDTGMFGKMDKTQTFTALGDESDESS